MLKAKLYEIELKRREDINNKNALDKGEIGWGVKYVHTFSIPTKWLKIFEQV